MRENGILVFKWNFYALLKESGEKGNQFIKSPRVRTTIKTTCGIGGTQTKYANMLKYFHTQHICNVRTQRTARGFPAWVNFSLRRYCVKRSDGELNCSHTSLHITRASRVCTNATRTDRICCSTGGFVLCAVLANVYHHRKRMRHTTRMRSAGVPWIRIQSGDGGRPNNDGFAHTLAQLTARDLCNPHRLQETQTKHSTSACVVYIC